MKRFISGLFILWLFNSCIKQTNSVTYVISPISIEGMSMLKVNMSFKTNSEKQTILRFQDNGWGEDSLYNVIHKMKLFSSKGDIIMERDSGRIVINHPKNSNNIEFEYYIKQDTEGYLTTEKVYRPVINKDYFHVFSHNLFMLPETFIKTPDANFNVDISWKDFPEEYVFHNSFQSGTSEQFIENTSESKFHSAVFMGGDFRVHHIKIKNNDVAFATRGDWQVFDDETMVEILEKTISTQRDFMQDHSQQYFAVSLIPTIQERGSSFQGTGLTNSFAMSASNNEFLELEGLIYLLNHEHQHNWIGHLIKNDNEEEQYWFSEGFTDYYTIKNIAKNKIGNLDADYFIDQFNNTIRAHYTSPIKEVPNSDINYKNFWTSRDYEKLPYRRGAIFAFYLDYKIQLKTNGDKSLDDVILEIKEDALKGQLITHLYFTNKLRDYLGDDFKAFFETHIEKGQLIDLEIMFREFEFEYNTKTTVFDLGFTFSEGNRSVAAINEDSEAHKAGLRVNDKFRSISVYNGSINHKAEFIVIRNGKEKTISYYPVREADIPQLKYTYNNKELNKV